MGNNRFQNKGMIQSIGLTLASIMFDDISYPRVFVVVVLSFRASMVRRDEWREWWKLGSKTVAGRLKDKFNRIYDASKEF